MTNSTIEQKTKTIEQKTKESRRNSAGPSFSVSAQSNEPGPDCPLCPRLKDYRDANRAQHPHWFNAPVPSFGPVDAQLLIIGLAPGLQGANRTGRPFTGDFAGDLLYGTLIEFGFARGVFEARPDDGLELVNCRISNAVRCVPPQNKPLPAEINTCRSFMTAAIGEMPRLRAIVMLGRVAHDTTLKGLGVRAAAAPFAHGAQHQAGTIRLFDSYHCSRYNTNTRVLTPEMFRAVFASVRDYLD
ncbi:eracil-DNA glycosylase [Bradyrhizobiaceae bacterium SG-6C]|nr:eracil-DNA glycosylase [Bradyrhizobiaceae bacterium SG-6C]